MKKIIHAIFIFVFVFFAQQSFAESIDRYSVDMILNTDSSVDIIETIDYNFGQNQRHGIFRFIPINFNVEGQEKMNGLQERKLEFSNLVVTRNGQPEIYTKKDKDSNGNYFVKIGDPNKTINGTHRYQMQYTVDGSLRYFEDFDEVYWNAIGLDWEIPIRNINVSLRGADPSLSFLNSSCYVGSVGSNRPCDNTIHRGNSIIYSHPALSSREGFTVSASLLEKGMVEQNELFGLSEKASFLGIIGLIFSFILGVIYSVRRYLNKYKIYDPIYPRYEPPKNLHPTYVGKLVDKQLNPRDISAGIIQLAIDGYISFEKTTKQLFSGNSNDYIFTLKKEKGNIHIHNILIDILFGDVYVLEKTKSRQKKMSDISKTFISVYISKLQNHVNNLLTGEKYLEKRGLKGNWIILIPVFSVFFFFSLGMIVPALICFAVVFLSFSVLSLVDYRYTKKGWETKFAILGFKNFLSMTEKDRYEFFNNPADNPQEFMEYLPYAIALGVEDKWAKQFESISMENPEWYKSSDSFVISHFIDDISHFSEEVSSSVATRSFGGSSSGSSGGGSSGGGSGGGGGGSW